MSSPEVRRGMNMTVAVGGPAVAAVLIAAGLIGATRLTAATAASTLEAERHSQRCDEQRRAATRDPALPVAVPTCASSPEAADRS